MDGLFILLVLGIVMGGTTFLAGSLPLSLSLTSSRLVLVSTIGMGVLVGTSLVVIIPEGVETLYSASSGTVGNVRRSMSSSPLQSVMESINMVRRDENSDVDAFLMPGPVLPTDGPFPPKTPTEPGVVGIMEESKEKEASSTILPQGETTKVHDHEGSQHAWVGVALISGFITMFLIDKLPQYTSSAQPKPRTHHIALNNLGGRFNMTTTLDRGDEADGFLGNRPSIGAENRSFATTTGLVIHAAADGIALGASSSVANSGLSFIIFFAIMIHKAPAAFGLTSILLKQGVQKRTARWHLILFSLAAPAGALITWTLARVIGVVNTGNADSMRWWTGLLLLFSGGTFLYVAMHSMQGVSTPNHEAHMNGHAGGLIDGRESSQLEQKPTLRDLLAACFGMILPLFLQIGHSH